MRQMRVLVHGAGEVGGEVVKNLATMGICCFGEQGMNHKRRACHGNLMFGCLLFSNKPREESFKKPRGQAGQGHGRVMRQRGRRAAAAVRRVARGARRQPRCGRRCQPQLIRQ